MLRPDYLAQKLTP